MSPSSILSDEDDLRKIWCHGFQHWRIAKELSGIGLVARDIEPFTSKSLFLIQYRLDAGERPCFLTRVHWPVLNWMLIRVHSQIDVYTVAVFWAPHWLPRNWAECDWRGFLGLVFVFPPCVDAPPWLPGSTCRGISWISGCVLGILQGACLQANTFLFS